MLTEKGGQWSCNNCDLYHELDVVCACTWIYICHTQVPIGLCQNNIILLFLGPLDHSCAAASKQIPSIEVNTACSSISSTCCHSPYITSVTSFCLYHYFCHLISGHQVALAVGLEYLHTTKYSLALSLSSFSRYLHNHVVNFYSCQAHFIFICLERNSKICNKNRQICLRLKCKKFSNRLIPLCINVHLG